MSILFDLVRMANKKPAIMRGIKWITVDLKRFVIEPRNNMAPIA